jgi:hypothetical protein
MTGLAFLRRMPPIGARIGYGQSEGLWCLGLEGRLPDPKDDATA